MAKQRSPSYPSISLPDAITRAEKIWSQDGTAPIASHVAVEHMGFKSMNGASRAALAALKKFGLLAGRAEEVRITSEAVSIFLDDGFSDSKTKRKLLLDSLRLIPAFSELYEIYGLNGSEKAMRAHLAKNGFSPDGSTSASKSYLESVNYINAVSPESGEADEGADEEGQEGSETESASALYQSERSAYNSQPNMEKDPVGSKRSGAARMKQDTYTLDKGELILAWPTGMSLDEVDDFDMWVDMMKKKVRRAVENRIKQDNESEQLPDDTFG